MKEPCSDPDGRSSLVAPTELERVTWARNKSSTTGALRLDPVRGGSSAHLTCLLPNATATWPANVFARLWGRLKGVRVMLQEVEMPRTPVSRLATNGLQGLEVCSYLGAPFDMYDAEIIVGPQAEGDPQTTPIASWVLRSGESEAPGSRHNVGLSRVVTGQQTLAGGLAPPVIRWIEANPMRRRVLVNVTFPAGEFTQRPVFIGPDPATVLAQGFALRVGNPPIELRDTRSFVAVNSDPTHPALLTWLAESA